MEYATELAPSALAAYSELLVQLMRAPTAAGLSYFTRPVKGRDYWYMQYSVGGARRSQYLGPDTAEVRAQVDEARRLGAEAAETKDLRERLASQAIAGGMGPVGAAEGRVYEVLAQSGVFDAGGVLVGSHAFFALGNMLGLRWTGGGDARTEDLDIGRNAAFEVALDAAPAIDLIEVLRSANRAFFPVPALDRKAPTTTFAIRGQALSVSLLAPATGTKEFDTVPVPALKAAAQTVRFLEFVLDDAQPAAVLTSAGVLVRVPSPARFALHKLVVAQRRSAHQQAKARKDLLQATALIEVLREQRPGDVTLALEASAAMPAKFAQQLKSGIKQLPDGLAAWVGERHPQRS
jgi:hypothetical protein